MKNLRLSRFLLTALLLSPLLAPIPAHADEEADHNALRAIKAAYEAAVNAGDPARLAPHLATNATAIMVTGEAIAGLAELENYWRKIKQLIGPGGSYHFTANVERTDLYGDLAVSRGTTDDTVRLPGGRELKFNSHWTAVCHREPGGWKILRLQATLDPVDNVFVRTKLATNRATWGAGGALASTLLTLLLLRFRSRQPRANSAFPPV